MKLKEFLETCNSMTRVIIYTEQSEVFELYVKDIEEYFLVELYVKKWGVIFSEGTPKVYFFVK